MEELIFDWAVEGGGESLFRQIIEGSEVVVKKASFIDFDENDNDLRKQNTNTYPSFCEYWAEFVDNPNWIRCHPLYIHQDLFDTVCQALERISSNDVSPDTNTSINEWKNFIENENVERLQEMLIEQIGQFPKDETDFTRKRRFHQGWWRTFVLSKPQGQYFEKGKLKKVCNRINLGKGDNFLSEGIELSIKTTIEERQVSKVGIIEEDRLFKNLLSSQPLAFNFFGEFKINKELGTKFFKVLFPEVIEVKDVYFEYPHDKSYINDHSAFDVAIIIESNNGQGLIGFECKHTDSFSFRPSNSKFNYGDQASKNHDNYKQVFDDSDGHFITDYYSFVQDNHINQLFRNELIGQALIQQGKFDFIYTGLFCDPDDRNALQAGRRIQAMIKDGFTKFRILTYFEFIEIFQRLPLSPTERQLSMLLWTRYCGFTLSDQLFNASKK